MATTKPRRIYGKWADGYVLDLHTVASTYLGEDEYGRAQYDTQRTEVGELLYRLKYHGDQTTLEELVGAADSFICSWGICPSVIVPVPPTRNRKVQPVWLLADELGERLGLPVLRYAVRKLKRYAELKDVHDADERRGILEGAFRVDKAAISGQAVLLFDDLYRSGATMNAIAEVLTASGASNVYAFALTKTRR